MLLHARLVNQLRRIVAYVIMVIKKEEFSKKLSRKELKINLVFSFHPKNAALYFLFPNTFRSTSFKFDDG